MEALVHVNDAKDVYQDRSSGWLLYLLTSMGKWSEVYVCKDHFLSINSNYYRY